MKRLAAALAALLALGTADAFWLEPRRLLVGGREALDLGGPPMRILHLSDLHVSEETPVLRKLLYEAAELRPDLIAISGDLTDDVADLDVMARHTAATAGVVASLRRVAPVYAVQGHSDYYGPYVAALERAGLVWLRNEGRRIGPGGSYLLLGIDQQTGENAYLTPEPTPFQPFDRHGGWHYGARDPGGRRRNFYSHYDPAPAGLSDEGGPLAWSGYDARVDVRVEIPETHVGIVAHSRYVRGEDRMIRLRYAVPKEGGTGTFVLVPHGSDFTGAGDRRDTGVAPEPGRWYRLRLSTRVEPGVVRAMAKVWPADEPEPERWQAWVEDRSPTRVESGTVGLWTYSGGFGKPVLFRDLVVEDDDGRTLLAAPLTGPEPPRGLRQGTRGTRLAMALARSPEVPKGTPRIVLSHKPDAVLEAARRGLDLVLAGHTHGGQVRLPFHGAITTRSTLGPHYSRGLFELAAPNPRGWTWLHISQGIGTSLLPVRFWCPPGYTVIELGR